MDINISSRHLDISENTKALINEKFVKMERLFNSIRIIEVVLKDDDRKKHCEAIIHTENHGTIVADVAHDDLHGAIDQVVDKCERQLRKLKEKTRTHRRKSSGRFQSVRPDK